MFQDILSKLNTEVLSQLISGSWIIIKALANFFIIIFDTLKSFL